MRILALVPFQVLPTHRFPEAFLLKELKSLGHNIGLVVCDGLFEKYCIAHTGVAGIFEDSSEEAKKKICSQCKLYRQAYTKIMTNAEFPRHTFESLLSPEKITEATRISNSVTKEEVTDLQISGCYVGRIASYEFVLNHKIADITAIDDSLFEHYRVHLKNTLLVLFAVENLAREKAYDALLIYNSSYSVNCIAREIFAKNTIPTVFIHAGFNLKHFHDSLILSWKKTFECFREANSYYIDRKASIEIDRSKFTYALEHIAELLKATSPHVYSLPRKKEVNLLKSRLNIGPEHKKVVLLSMSSVDEIYGAFFAFGTPEDMKKIKQLYPDQLTWVKAAIEHFKNRPEYKLIVRIHPREFPNKREKVKSMKVAEYDRLFSSLPPNIHANYPSDQISIYDLFEIVDLNLVASSSSGIESAMLGIPGLSIISGNGLYPIPLINQAPESVEEYFPTADKILSRNTTHSIEVIEKAVTWSNWYYSQVIMNFDSEYFDRTNSLKKLIQKIRRKMQKPAYDLRRYLRKTSLPENERDALKSFFERKIEFYEAREILKNKRAEVVQSKLSTSQMLSSYLRSLFALWYSTPPLNDQTLFELIPSGRGVTVSSQNERLKIQIPTDCKLAVFIVDAIQKL